MSANQSVVEQQTIKNWFDKIYRDKGFRYLRPFHAYPIFIQLLKGQPGERLLDVACGPGLLLRAGKLKGMNVSGIDISDVALDLAREALPDADLRCGSAEELPFDSNEFDCITCVGALERFLDREAALREMLRVAKPGARLCVMGRNAQTPSWRLWSQGLKQQNVEGHQDALTLRQWTDLFEGMGLEVLSVHPDQWARQKLRRVLRFGRTHNFQTPERVARSVIPLRWVNEFVFLMRKPL